MVYLCVRRADLGRFGQSMGIGCSLVALGDLVIFHASDELQSWSPFLVMVYVCVCGADLV